MTARRAAAVLLIVGAVGCAGAAAVLAAATRPTWRAEVRAQLVVSGRQATPYEADVLSRDPVVLTFARLIAAAAEEGIAPDPAIDVEVRNRRASAVITTVITGPERSDVAVRAGALRDGGLASINRRAPLFALEALPGDAAPEETSVPDPASRRSALALAAGAAAGVAAAGGLTVSRPRGAPPRRASGR